MISQVEMKSRFFAVLCHHVVDNGKQWAAYRGCHFLCNSSRTRMNHERCCDDRLGWTFLQHHSVGWGDVRRSLSVLRLECLSLYATHIRPCARQFFCQFLL